MWVVKLGGSLYAASVLRDWLAAVAGRGGGRVVLAPGGGPFVDQVRAAQKAWGFDDATAHRMAVCAVDQYGWMLCGMQPGLVPAPSLADIQGALAGGQVPVWLPGAMLGEEPGLARDWSVTSDTLAAWLAGHFGAAHLLLVKSVAFDGDTVRLSHLVREGIVDPAFADQIRDGGFHVCVAGRDEHLRLGSWLIAATTPPGACRVLVR
jgi:aspartokinase-like uncharacterized kinase